MAASVHYALRYISLRPRQRPMSISESEFVAFREANTILIVVLGLEEKLEFVLANYAEYENELLRLAMDQLVWHDAAWSGYRVAAQTVNRRIVNLLTTARLYLDQTRHEISTVCDASAAAQAAVNEAASREYDAHFEYRVMEALRNYVQHRGVPVHELTFPRLIDADHDPVTVQYSAVPVLHPRRLARDREFKRAVLDELLARGESWPVTPLIRQYVASLARIHSVVRRLTDPAVERAEAQLAPVIKRAKRRFGDDLGKVMLYAEHPGEPIVRRYYFAEILTERRALRSKNGGFDNLVTSYAVSEPPAVERRGARKPTG